MCVYRQASPQCAAHLQELQYHRQLSARRALGQRRHLCHARRPGAHAALPPAARGGGCLVHRQGLRLLHCSRRGPGVGW